MPPRRSMLIFAAAAIVVTGCTDQPAGRLPSNAPAAPDELLRRKVVAAEADLVALYAAARAAHPRFGDALAAVETRHRQHFAAVASSGRVALTNRAPRPTASALSVPAEPAAALDTLRSAEERATEARLGDCLRCADPDLAELLAAIAAGEAANSVLLPSAS
jgi:hypothetical protein